MKTSRIALLPLIVATSFSSIADDFILMDSDEDELGGFYGDEEFVNIATGNAKLISKAPAVASVITSEQIAHMGASYLDEVLERVPGLHVSVSKLNRFDSIYSMRGIQTGRTPQILVLLNGLEFKNSLTGALPFTFRLPAKSIERIEVLRGPGSAVYGADSFSGVINIVTKSELQEGQNTGSASIRMASFDTREFWFEAGYKEDDLSVYFQGARSRSDGDQGRIVYRDAQSNFDNLFNTNQSHAPGAVSTQFDITDIRTTVKYNGFQFEHWYWQQDRGGVGPGAGQALDPSGYQNAQLNRWRASYTYEVNHDLSFEMDVSYLNQSQHTLFHIFPESAIVPILPDGNIGGGPGSRLVFFKDGVIGAPSSDQDDTRVNAVANYIASENHTWRFSLGWFEQEVEAQEWKNFGPGILDMPDAVVPVDVLDRTGTPYIYHPDVSRTVRYLSIQDEWKIANDWELTLGLRYDDYSDFGETVNPRAALVWETSHNLTTKLLYGSAFRAPSFTEQFLQNNPVSLGNSELDPEEIDTYELSFDYRPTYDSQIIVSFFTYEATGMIELVPESPGVRRNQNAIDQVGSGFELVFNYEFSESLHLESNYAFQNSKNEQTNHHVPDAPRKQAFIGLDYSISDEWSSTLQAHWIADRQRELNDQRAPVDDFTNVNASVIYQPSASPWRTKLSVRNLFDSDQREQSTGAMDDYPMEGRRISLEVTLEF